MLATRGYGLGEVLSIEGHGFLITVFRELRLGCLGENDLREG